MRGERTSARQIVYWGKGSQRQLRRKHERKKETYAHPGWPLGPPSETIDVETYARRTRLADAYLVTFLHARAIGSLPRQVVWADASKGARGEQKHK